MIALQDVFIVPFRVTPMARTIMPPGMGQAYVSCYSGGSDYGEAVEKCLAALIADGMHPAEVLQPIGAMALRDWSAHVAEKWPDHAGMLPKQLDFEASVKGGGVVYGPIGAF